MHRFLPPDQIERRLRQVELIALKSAIPRKLGLSPYGWARDRFVRLLRQLERVAPRRMAIKVAGSESGVLASFVTKAGSRETSGVTGWLKDGEWLESPATVAPIMLEVSRATATAELTIAESRQVRQLLEPVRARIEESQRSLGLTARQLPPGAGRLVARLHQAADQAVRSRDYQRLQMIDNVMRFFSRGHKAGEAQVVESLSQAEPDEIIRRLSPWCRDYSQGEIEVVLATVVMVEQAA